MKRIDFLRDSISRDELDYINHIVLESYGQLNPSEMLEVITGGLGYEMMSDKYLCVSFYIGYCVGAWEIDTDYYNSIQLCRREN